MSVNSPGAGAVHALSSCRNGMRPLTVPGACRCVVSSVSAVSYLQTIVDHVPLIPTSIAVVVVFGLLLTWGLRDSANVALTIFSLHFVTLCILIVASLVFVIQDGGAVLKYNWTVPWPDITSSSGEVFHGNVFYAIFFGVLDTGSLSV